MITESSLQKLVDKTIISPPVFDMVIYCQGHTVNTKRQYSKYWASEGLALQQESKQISNLT